jgi:hypothetical protein
MTELSRQGETLGGAGIPMAVVQFAASRLNRRADVATTEEPDTLLVNIGNVRGSIHDGCFVSFDNAEPAFEAALLDGVQALHSHYLARTAPGTAFAAVRAALTEGKSVRVRSVGLDIEVTSFPFDASWLTRFLSPRARFRASAT